MTHQKKVRVLVVGAGSPNADIVAETLNQYGSVHAEWTDRVKYPNPFLLRRFDIIYGIYLQTCSRHILVAKALAKKTIIHFVGSDAYWFRREQSIIRRIYWRIVLRSTDVIFYVSDHLEDLVGRKGYILPFPIAKSSFEESPVGRSKPDRDVLYYCPGGSANARIYRLSWIVQYAKEHRHEQITIVGNVTHPADYTVDLPNVEVIPFVQRNEMPQLYLRHKKLIRMTEEDGLPRMLHEALLSGLQVIFNGEEINKIPRERDPKEFASSFRTALNVS